jgi:hypothetical protein
VAHGVVWTTVAYMETRVSNELPMTIRPVSGFLPHNFRYIDNQATGAMVFWPDVATGESMRWHCCTYQEKFVRPWSRGWKNMLDAAVKEGTPCKTMRPQGRRLRPTVRDRLRRRSRFHASMIRRTWHIALVEIRVSGLLQYINDAADTFGINGIRYWARGMRNWASQPVLLCRTQAEYLEAQDYVEAYGIPVTHIVYVREF